MFKNLKSKKVLSAILSLSLVFSCAPINNAQTAPKTPAPTTEKTSSKGNTGNFLKKVKSVVTSPKFIIPTSIISGLSVLAATPCIYNNVKYNKPRNPIENHIKGESEERVSNEYGGYLYATYSSRAETPWKVYNHYPQDNTTLTRKFTENEEHSKLLESKINEILGEINKQSLKTDFEKAVFLHDYIYGHCKYEWGTLVDHCTEFKTHFGSGSAVYDGYGCLIDGKAVCEGIAKAYMLLLTRAGVECRVIFGNAYGMGHTWNVVKINGQWYHVDVTWDLSFHTTHGKYRWFMLSEEEISKDHNDFKMALKD